MSNNRQVKESSKEQAAAVVVEETKAAEETSADLRQDDDSGTAEPFVELMGVVCTVSARPEVPVTAAYEVLDRMFETTDRKEAYRRVLKAKNVMEALSLRAASMVNL